jgi:hypothetical protein
MALERSEILAGIKSRFLIITLYVGWIEMLAADVSEFIEKPRWGSHDAPSVNFTMRGLSSESRNSGYVRCLNIDLLKALT